eukprot:GHRR01005864.1.p1 GENE.GHRR01005864.1~~GHRR01005864.1.p1  ORF type:complete len:266 (+),score=97.63 GHRR01005864.1:4469-5266(+)
MMDGYGGYYDDGLGGLGGMGDDGLGGLGGMQQQQTYEPQPMFADDGLMLFPAEEQPIDEAEPITNKENEDPDDAAALDAALGIEPAQATSGLDSMSQLPSRTQHTSGYDDDDDDDEATEDEVVEEEGDEQTGGQADVEEEQQPEDPTAAEAQRQNAWYKECFDAMTEAQRNRLEAYIRSNLQKKTMKKVLQELTGTQLNDRIVIAIGSITKMFVGELIETARQIAAGQGHTGALLPSHVRTAYNALNADGRAPQQRTNAKRLRLM